MQLSQQRDGNYMTASVELGWLPDLNEGSRLPRYRNGDMRAMAELSGVKPGSFFESRLKDADDQ